jgi:hypothetical protein
VFIRWRSCQGGWQGFQGDFINNSREYGALILGIRQRSDGTLHPFSAPQRMWKITVYSANWQMEINDARSPAPRHSFKLPSNHHLCHGRRRQRATLSGFTPPALPRWKTRRSSPSLFKRNQIFLATADGRKNAEEGTLEFALEIMKVYEAALLSQGSALELE